MTRAQYLSDHGLTVREFAAKAEMSPSFLWEITTADAAKRKNPSLDMAVRIQKATNGEVAVGDWPKLARIAKEVHALKSVSDRKAIQVCPEKNINSGGRA